MTQSLSSKSSATFSAFVLLRSTDDVFVLNDKTKLIKCICLKKRRHLNKYLKPAMAG